MTELALKPDERESKHCFMCKGYHLVRYPGSYRDGWAESLGKCPMCKHRTREPVCERCDDPNIMVCLNGRLWLCWDCYCAEMKPTRADEAAAAAMSDIVTRLRAKP